MIKSRTCVVCDAGPVIHLDELGCCRILIDFNRVLIPDRVHDEIEKHRPGALDRVGEKAWEKARLKRTNDKTIDLICRMFSLDGGETEAIGVLSENPSFVFLTDDAAARIVAQKLNFQVHGTLGVLIRAARRNLMTPQQVVDVLQLIPQQSTLYIKPSLLAEAISKVRIQYDI